LGDGQAFCQPEGEVDACARGERTAGLGVEVAEGGDREIECAGDFLLVVRKGCVERGGGEGGYLGICEDGVDVVVRHLER